MLLEAVNLRSRLVGERSLKRPKGGHAQPHRLPIGDAGAAGDGGDGGDGGMGLGSVWLGAFGVRHLLLPRSNLFPSPPNPLSRAHCRNREEMPNTDSFIGTHG